MGKVGTLCLFLRKGSFPFFDEDILENVDIFVGMIA